MQSLNVALFQEKSDLWHYRKEVNVTKQRQPTNQVPNAIRDVTQLLNI